MGFKDPKPLSLVPQTVRATGVISYVPLTLTEDRLKIFLTEFKDATARQWQWQVPLGWAATLGICLLTSSFTKKFGVPPEYWWALFMLGFLVCLYRTVINVVSAYRAREEASVQGLIDRIKAHCAEGVDTANQLPPTISGVTFSPRSS